MIKEMTLDAVTGLLGLAWNPETWGIAMWPCLDFIPLKLRSSTFGEPWERPWKGVSKKHPLIFKVLN